MSRVSGSAGNSRSGCSAKGAGETVIGEASGGTYSGIGANKRWTFPQIGLMVKWSGQFRADTKRAGRASPAQTRGERRHAPDRKAALEDAGADVRRHGSRIRRPQRARRAGSDSQEGSELLDGAVFLCRFVLPVCLFLLA